MNALMNPTDSLSRHFRLNPLEVIGLKKLGILTIRDLLYYFPLRYGDSSEAKRIEDLILGETTAVYGRIKNLKTGKAYIKKTPMSEGTISDETGALKAVWFHQPYIAKMINEDSLVRVEGKVSLRKGGLYMSNPKIETVTDIPLNIGDSLFGGEGDAHILYPVYGETKGVTSNWIHHAFRKIIRSTILDKMPDPIPEVILQKYNLPTLHTALIWIHTPQHKDDALSARKRFAFEEVFLIQLKKQQERKLRQQEKTALISGKEKKVNEFLARFPFKPTNAQTKAIEGILSDFKSEQAMSRLLEGDVGSGKTLVAAATAFAATAKLPDEASPDHQVAYMAPTEILARQHFESFISYFGHLPIKIALITGSGCLKFPSKVNPETFTTISRTQLLKWVKNGEISIVIGTHALIQKSVQFKNLSYVIIDEQHRFGTKQRKALVNKNEKEDKSASILPHLLSMTATPIPRTLSLTMYGDLDLTLLDEMPAGRKPIITEIILPHKRTEMYEKVKQQLQAGRQAYVICPRINAPDPDKEKSLNARSVKEEAEMLQNTVFNNYTIDIMHSKMKPAEKDKVMKEFYAGKIDILVSTSVVEVGVNVPNATVIMIEGAERFGLSQLHQLRGRVLRSNNQAYCYILTETKSEKSSERLRALTRAKNGFELAELDLNLRGAGELYGRKQWGLSDIAMDALKNLKMVEFARNEAKNLIDSDPNLSQFPILKKVLAEKEDVHFE